MTKKGKRAAGAAARVETSKRKPAGGRGGSSGDGGGEAEAEVLASNRVAGPPVLPPAPRKDVKKRLELDLSSKRVYHDTIFSIDNLLKPRECAAWISYGEERGFERSFHAQTSEIAHRDNGRITVNSPEVAAALFARLSPFVPAKMGQREVAGCNANIRIYKYVVGQRFGKHVDESVEDENGHLSQWTVLVYLNGGNTSSTLDGRGSGGSIAEGGRGEYQEPLRGGQTVFYKGSYGAKIAASFSPREGACLIHGHGQRCLLHEGAAVTSGVKYVLRSDVMYA